MKKVMIYAYTRLNLGDDLFIKLLSERYSNTYFYLYASDEYKKLFKDVKNIKVFSNNNPLFRIINFLFRTIGFQRLFIRSLIANSCDAAINIGGSLFIQDAKWKQKLDDRKHMQIKKKPFFLLGANFGPYKDVEYYHKYKDLFKSYTDICFRDKYSYELFKDLPNVRMADDIVFQLGKNKKTQNTNKKSVFISVIKPSNKNHLVNHDKCYYNKIKDIIITLNKNEYKINLVSFCKYEGDQEAIEEILELLPPKNLEMVNAHYYKYNIEETLELIADSNCVIATRFHSMILGWSYNKPVFPIVYSEKMINVMNDVGFKGYYTDIERIEELNPEDVLRSINTNKTDVSAQIKNAQEHFIKLDKFLN